MKTMGKKILWLLMSKNLGVRFVLKLLQINSCKRRKSFWMVSFKSKRVETISPTLLTQTTVPIFPRLVHLKNKRLKR